MSFWKLLSELCLARTSMHDLLERSTPVRFSSFSTREHLRAANERIAELERNNKTLSEQVRVSDAESSQRLVQANGVSAPSLLLSSVCAPQVEFHTVSIPFGSLKSERKNLKEPLLSLALTGTDSSTGSAPKRSKRSKRVTPVAQRHLAINGSAEGAAADGDAAGSDDANGSNSKKSSCCVVS